MVGAEELGESSKLRLGQNIYHWIMCMCGMSMYNAIFYGGLYLAVSREFLLSEHSGIIADCAGVVVP